LREQFGHRGRLDGSEEIIQITQPKRRSIAAIVKGELVEHTEQVELLLLLRIYSRAFTREFPNLCPQEEYGLEVNESYFSIQSLAG